MVKIKNLIFRESWYVRMEAYKAKAELLDAVTKLCEKEHSVLAYLPADYDVGRYDLADEILQIIYKESEGES